MQAEREEMNQQDRRVVKAVAESQQQQQPQKCPRCESLNTKFCYYNNYSLSQPRYFCKTCRRYWTQGGTLRNVPVGGGCRKGKRAKTSASGENSRSQPPPTPPQPSQQAHQILTNPPAIISSGALPSQYYPAGSGYLSSLVAIRSLSQSQPFDQALDAGSDDQLGGNNSSSNMRLLQGFNAISSFGSQQQRQIQQPSDQTQFYHQMASHSSSSPHEWAQSFMNSSGAAAATSESALWSIGSNTNAAGANTATAGSSFNPNQWPDLPGYGPPP